MEYKFLKLYNKLISQAKRSIYMPEYKFDDEFNLGFVCPICNQFSTRVSKDNRYFLCKYFPNCHGKATYINVNNPLPKQQQIVDLARDQYFEIKNKQKAEREARLLKLKQDEENRVNGLITAIYANQPIMMVASAGRFSTWNSALNEYWTFKEKIQLKEIKDDKLIFNVFKRIKLKQHRADSITYQIDYDFTDEIEGQAYALKEQPLKVKYKNQTWSIIEKYDKNKEYYDTFQPSTYGT